jgi:hypothetical protein
VDVFEPSGALLRVDGASVSDEEIGALYGKYRRRLFGVVLLSVGGGFQ